VTRREPVCRLYATGQRQRQLKAGRSMLTSKSNKTKHTGSQMYFGLRTAVMASVSWLVGSVALFHSRTKRSRLQTFHVPAVDQAHACSTHMSWLQRRSYFTVKSSLFEIPRHYQKQSVNDSQKHGFSNYGSRHQRGSWTTPRGGRLLIPQEVFKYSSIDIVFIRFRWFYKTYLQGNTAQSFTRL
jgi:hypothetical protein